MNKDKKNRKQLKSERYPIGHAEDVEFSEDLADQEDWEALERSERADARQQGQYKL
ncbi:hypothetical protein D3C76_1307310 [compost metagenome]